MLAQFQIKLGRDLGMLAFRHERQDRCFFRCKAGVEIQIHAAGQFSSTV